MLYRNVVGFTLLFFVAWNFFKSVHAQTGSVRNEGLAAYWPLSSDARDPNAESRTLRIHGDQARITRTGLDVRGESSWLELDSQLAPKLGKKEFSISLWMQSDEHQASAPGDLISQYDASSQRGFHLTLKSNLGVTTNQANWRHLQFGIDDHRSTEWIDSGRPGKSLVAFALASHQGELYAGTCEPGKGESGRVYRYRGGTEWIDCGAPDRSNSVMALAVFENELYAGTGKYRLAGSALPESENETLGGRVFRYAGDQRWIDCGQLPSTETVGGLIHFRGKLYATSLYRPAGFFRYEGGDRWTDCGTPDGKRVEALAFHEGYLYACSFDGGHVYRYDGEKWIDCGQLGENTQTYSFTRFEGGLYVGTWPSGSVYRLDGIDRWSNQGRLGEELEVMGMIVHNGRFLAGSLPLAEVYSFEGDRRWKKLARLDHTPDVKYRRAWTMAEHAGSVFCSTLPSGKIFRFSAGHQVSMEHSLDSQWHHVVAVRQRDRLLLYVDGFPVGTSKIFASEDYDLDSKAPWRIGSGRNGPFNGTLRELRIYDRAISEPLIRELSQSPPVLP